jgi:hypothetical protein
MEMRIRLWLGVGSWAMASSLASAAPADDPSPRLASPAQAEVAPQGEAALAQGGIGNEGEGGEGAIPAGPTTEGLGMTSDRLVAQWSVQTGTLGAPPGVAGTPDRDGQQAVLALRESAVAWRPPAGEVPPQPRIEAILALLNRASAEYGEAVAGGRIKEPLEYHDSRGLFLIARQAFERQVERLYAADPQATAAITAELDQLASTWPATAAPKASVMSRSEVAAAISRIELNASQLLRGA